MFKVFLPKWPPTRPKTPPLQPSTSTSIENEVAKILKSTLEKYKIATLWREYLPSWIDSRRPPEKNVTYLSSNESLKFFRFLPKIIWKNKLISKWGVPWWAKAWVTYLQASNLRQDLKIIVSWNGRTYGQVLCPANE